MPTQQNITTKPEEVAYHGVAQGPNATAIFGDGAAVGVRGEGTDWHGVAGISSSTTGGAGVAGEHKSSGAGVYGFSLAGPGVFASGKAGPGVYATSESGEGIHVDSKSNKSAALAAYNTSPASAPGGPPDQGTAIFAHSQAYEAVHAETHSAKVAAVAAYNLSASNEGAAIYAEHKGLGPAAIFKGNVVVLGGDLTFPNAADVAEEFELDSSGAPEPGTVLVISGTNRVAVSDRPYDHRVAGVVTGAGEYRPGIVLDGHPVKTGRAAVALIGRVFCKADTSNGPIRPGDLLTTSATPGHAMRAETDAAVFGSILGKAMSGLSSGSGLVPILVTLR